MIYRMTFAVLATMALAACSSPYEKIGLLGGVDALPVANDIYRISAVGNGYTSTSTIQDYVLLKSADTAIAHGATSFTLLGGQDTTTNSYGQTPGSLTVNTLGSTSYATYSPGFSFEMIKPGQDVMVRIWTPGPKDPIPPMTFVAQQIEDNINPRVHRPKNG